VFSASITTVIAFSALLAIGGRFGDWLLVLPMTVGIVMIASLVECFLILPAHMRHALASRERRSWIDAPSRWVNAGFDWFRRVIFRRLVATAMRLRYPVIAGAIAALLLSLTLQFSGQVRWFFIQFPERGTIQANIAMMPGADREDTFAMLAEMRRALQVANAHYAQKHGRAPVIDTVAILGGGTGRGLAAAETKDPDTLGGFEIELIDPDDRPYSAMAFIQTWRAQIKKHPLLETLALRGDRSGPGGDAIDIALSGLQAPDVLKKAAIRLQDLLAALPGVSALEDSMPYDKPERILILTPKGRALGFTTDAIAAELRARLEGVSAAIFPYGEQEARVMVVGPDTASRVSALYNIRLISANGITAPLSDIVDIMEQPSFASVKRLDGKVVVTVNGDIVEDAETRAFVSSELTSRILPAIEAAFGVETEQGGLARQERDFLSDAMVGFYACLIGIYATLAWVFRSWSRPVIVLLAIPFGYVGAVWGHYWMGVALSMFSVVGLIGMAGIIINDSIVLITAIDERMRRQPVFEAVVDGVLDRFRAVLLTTLTTVGGLAPLLYETSRQAIFLKPTVITLAFGLAFGMVIVLFVTPAMVLASQDISRRLVAFRHLRRWLFSRRRWRLGGERSTLRQ
jgi:multidrug efflux pump subunit AcrB